MSKRGRKRRSTVDIKIKYKTCDLYRQKYWREMYDDFERQGLMDRHHRKPPSVKKEKLSKPRVKKTSASILENTAVEPPIRKSSPLQMVESGKVGRKRKKDVPEKTLETPKLTTEKKTTPKTKKTEESLKKTTKSVPARVVKARITSHSDEENSPVVKKRRVTIPPSSEDDRSPCKPRKQQTRKSINKRNSKTPKVSKATAQKNQTTPKKKSLAKKKKEAKSVPPPRRNLRETPERKNRRNSHDSFDSLFVSDEDTNNQTLTACIPSQALEKKRLSFENYSPIRNIFESSSDDDSDDDDDDNLSDTDNMYNFTYISTMRRSPKKFAQSVPAKLRKSVTSPLIKER